MKNGTKFVGMDVHQEATAASVRDARGRVIARVIVPTEAAALVEFMGGMRGAIHVGFEEGTQAQWLHDLLEPVVDRVVAADRRGEKKQGNKGDRIDADEISDLLRRGSLRPVYHGGPHGADLRELARGYENLVEDSTRVRQRLKALYRARGIQARGMRLYHPEHRAEWLAKLPNRGARVRAEMLLQELDLLRELRPRAKAAMVAEARRDPAWAVLTSIPFFGPVRVSLLLATLRTPWRFRTKRNLWAYAGLKVVTHTSSEFRFERGRPVRRKRQPMTRGLNRNYNHRVKNIFKSAAAAATARPGPLQDFYLERVEGGMDPALAQLTLARKLAAVVLRLWKRGERFDPKLLTQQAH